MMIDESDRHLPTRRQFLSLGIGAFVVAAVPLSRSARRALVRRTVPVMGTIAELGVVHRDARFAHAAMDAAVAELIDVDRRMSRFLATSEVGRANALAARRAVEVSPATATVLAAALRWAEASDGAFDPCLGGAVALWDLQHRHAPPGAVQVHRFAGRRLYRGLELGRSGGRDVVVFHDADLAIDLGGIAKGWGVDRAVHALRSWGVSDAIVNVGGDLYALGASEDGDPWEVGVRSPVDPNTLVARFRLSDRAVATSGDYIQYFDHDGRRYHHLLDPRTGEPRRTSAHSLTIAAADCMGADAAATTLFGSPVAQADGLLRRAAPGAKVLHRA